MEMKISFGTRSAIAFVVFVGWFLISPSRMSAQSGSPGQKAVYGPNGLTGSAVWVDASAWWNPVTTPVPDLCSIIQLKILTSGYGSSSYPNGTVIDARGLAYGVKNGTQTACSVNPFGALTGPPPSTILLLPSGFVDTNVTWVVPNNTTLIGDEQGTTIRAKNPSNGLFSGSYIIEMGGTNNIGGTVYHLCPQGGACTGIGIEHLFLEGALVTGVGGIDNQYSQAGSYVNNVNLDGFSLTGLFIEAPSSTYPGATNSGPYSNIVFNAGSNTPTCIDLETQTQGIHGVTCIGNSSTVVNPFAGIVVNAGNNSIEDAHIESYWDGIQVGPANTPVTNVLISNVTTGDSLLTKNTVHLCGPSPLPGSTFGNCAGNYVNATVKDVTIFQAMNGNGIQTTTVVDDVSKNAIVACFTKLPTAGPGCAYPILSTGMYVLGEPDAGSTTTNPAYTKFSSSPTTLNGNYNNGSSYMPTWGVGTVLPDSQLCSPVGAIYSQTGTTGKSVYVCNASGNWITIR
jgi:hypothetical protein